MRTNTRILPDALSLAIAVGLCAPVAELVALEKQRQVLGALRAAAADGAETDAGPMDWYESLQSGGTRPWLIVDPKDGKLPALTPQAAQREAAIGALNSERLQITERFTPVAPGRLEWQLTFTDPDTWTRPWTFEMPLTRDDGHPVFEYACHEGNLGLEHILSAPRAEEAAAEGRR
jgi:hypothetical protein